MTTPELLDHVRRLRASGATPAQMARELGLTKAQVQPLLRQTAGSTRASTPERVLPVPGDRALAGCWVNPGWSADLGLDDAPEWAMGDAGTGSDGTAGLVTVVVGRAERRGRVTLCSFLVDVFCLGVKNTVGPQTLSDGKVRDRLYDLYGGYDDPPRSAPLDLARHLVHGAVGYARALGFEPHKEFAHVVPYLGPAPDACRIRFGKDGLPFYISGPHDDPRAVLGTLERTVGSGNYHYFTHVTPF